MLGHRSAPVELCSKSQESSPFKPVLSLKKNIFQGNFFEKQGGEWLKHYILKCFKFYSETTAL